MVENEFQLELDLQTLSMVSLAARLWDLPDIKTEIRNYFLQRTNSTRRYENWHEIGDRVWSCLDSSRLPSKVLIKLEIIIRVIGEKIHDWVHHVTEILRLDFIYTEKIYWTSYGTIDEVRIFDLYWQGLNGTSDCFHHLPISSLACMYGHVRYIDEHRREMIEELAPFHPYLKTSPVENEIYNIMSTSLYLNILKNGSEAWTIVNDHGLYDWDNTIRSVDLRDNDVVIEPIYMFQLCLMAGFNKPARYYWGRLDETLRVSNLATFAKKALKMKADDDDDDLFLQEKHCEMFLFLINLMTENERRRFINRNINQIIFTFLPIWPYQKFILSFLYFDWTERDATEDSSVNSIHCKGLLPFILKSIRIHHKSERNIYFQIFEKVWQKSAPRKKRSFAFNNIDVLFVTDFDIPILNLILNDDTINDDDETRSDLTLREIARRRGIDPSAVENSERFRMMELRLKNKLKATHSVAESGCRELAKNGRFSDIDRLMEEVLLSNKVKTELKKSYSYILNDVIRNDRFDIADEFLNWISDSPEERTTMKNEMDSVYLCESLTTSYKFELAERFLKWRFESDDEIKNFKDLMKSNEIKTSGFGSTQERTGNFISENVYRIWSDKSRTEKNLKNVCVLCDNFIKFFYETNEEVVQFKIQKLNLLDDENFLQFLFTNILKDHTTNRFVIMDALFEFCLIPQEKISETKGKMRDDIEKWMDSYVIVRHNLHLADFLINWLYDTKEQKMEASKKYLNSSNKGALICKSYLDKMTEDYRFLDSNLVTLGTWLSLISDFEKLKNDLLLIVEENPPEWFLFFLDKLVCSDLLSAVGAVRREHFRLLF